MLPSKIMLIMEALPLGPMLRKAIHVLLWILTGLVVFAGLYYVIDMIMSLTYAQNPVEVIGTLISILVLLAGTAVLGIVLLFRIQDIANLNSLNYPVMQIGAHLLRMLGEVLAVVHVVAGVTIGIAHWFGAYQALPYFNSLMSRILLFASFPSFVSGLMAILASAFQAALTIIACYLGAELLLLLRNLTARK